MKKVKSEEIEPEEINFREEGSLKEKEDGDLPKVKPRDDIYVLGKSEVFLRKIRGY